MYQMAKQYVYVQFYQLSPTHNFKDFCFSHYKALELNHKSPLQNFLQSYTKVFFYFQVKSFYFKKLALIQGSKHKLRFDKEKS